MIPIKGKWWVEWYFGRGIKHCVSYIVIRINPGDTVSHCLPQSWWSSEKHAANKAEGK